MSENIVAGGDSTPESTEAITIDPGLATDVDGLAGQLERMLTPQPEPSPPSEELEETEEMEAPSDEPPSGETSEEGESEEVLSQTESEESAEVEPAAEEEVSDGPSPQKGLLKRIDKLTAKRREAEEKVDDLELEVKRLREEIDSREDMPEIAKIPSANPYSNLTSASAVQKEIERAEEIVEWCEDNPDGAIVEKKGGEDIDYSAEDIRNIKKNARKALRKHLPERLDYLKEENDVNAQVDQVFTYWKDRSSVGYQEAMEILKNRPEIKTNPTWKADVSIYQLGLQAYREMISSPKSNSSKPKAKAPAQPAAPTAAPAKPKPAAARSASARKSFDAQRDESSLANVILNDYM